MIHLLNGVNHARPQTQYLDSSFPSDALGIGSLQDRRQDHDADYGWIVLLAAAAIALWYFSRGGTSRP